MENVKDLLKEAKPDTTFILESLISMLQPPEVSTEKQFKENRKIK